MKIIQTPITNNDIKEIRVGDMITISGYIYTGRDAVLPKVVRLIEDDNIKEIGIDLNGSVIFHTAVSKAGVGPTSSNKLDIESSMPALSKAGVKIHLGKGALNKKTVEQLDNHNSIYAVIPPVTALLQSKIIEQRVVAFDEEGMEALHELKVDAFPAIVAAAHGETLY
jgi:fumarate hydratase subunit beta